MKMIRKLVNILLNSKPNVDSDLGFSSKGIKSSFNEDDKMHNVIKRRNFFGISLGGFMGLFISPTSALENEIDIDSNLSFSPFPTTEKTYWDRTDHFDIKLDLLESAWEKKDYRLVRALSDSLRSSSLQALQDQEIPGKPISDSSHFGMVKELPVELRSWANGWKYYKLIHANPSEGNKRKATDGLEMLGYPVNSLPIRGFNSQEPVELLLSFNSDQINSPKREIRIAQLEEGELREITSQVYGELRRNNEWFCNVIFLAKSQAVKKQIFLIFYGNPDAELPGYESDLKTRGDGYGLEIENDFIRVELSKQTGQIKELTLKRERSLNLYAGGLGHGEPPGIDWAHDYVSEGKFQKFRTTLWDECPDYEIIKGPVCTIVRRYGFPYSPLHPVFSPSRLNMDIEYRFYSGLPYFHKISDMTALKEFEIEAIRDDEWVFTGQDFTDILWMSPNGNVNIGEVDSNFKDNLWGVGFYHNENKDSFMALFLDHTADGLPIPSHSGSPTLYNKWHGQLWSRYPYTNRVIPEGAVVHQKNAYVTIPFTTEDGPAIIEELREQMMNPLTISSNTFSKDITLKNTSGQLARHGEAGDSPIPKELLWEALRENCKDGQIRTALLSIVDLGFIYDISVDGGTVKVVMAMPHRGRPLGIYFQYGSNELEVYYGSINLQHALLNVPGVLNVVVEQTWYPGWTSNLITDEGRRLLELDT